MLIEQKDSDAHFTDLIATMLKRKREIDNRNLNYLNMKSYDKWLVDAVEMLLQIELMRRT